MKIFQKFFFCFLLLCYFSSPSPRFFLLLILEAKNGSGQGRDPGRAPEGDGAPSVSSYFFLSASKKEKARSDSNDAHKSATAPFFSTSTPSLDLPSRPPFSTSLQHTRRIRRRREPSWEMYMPLLYAPSLPLRESLLCPRSFSLLSLALSFATLSLSLNPQFFQLKQKQKQNRF